jgi:HAMP domain-containing protein
VFAYAEAAMSGQRTGGDLAVRMPERGVGEIGALERSFTRMAGSLGLAATSWARARSQQR